MMNGKTIRANKPDSLLKSGTTFTDEHGTEWTIVVSAGDGTAAVESEDQAGEYANGMIYLCQDGDTHGANYLPEYIVRNGSWYKNQLMETKKEEFVLTKNAVFRKKRSKIGQ